MGNDTKNPRFWILDKKEVLAPIGSPVIIRKIVYYPDSIDDNCTFQEYDNGGVLRDAVHLKASHTNIEPVSIDFGDQGRAFNGLKLSSIDHGTVEVYIDIN